MLVGIGYYFFAVIIYILMWTVVFFDNFLERKGIGSYQKKMVITTSKIVNEKDIRNVISLSSKRYKLITINVDKANKSLTITYLVEGRREELSTMTQRLYDQPWFSSCKVE